MDESTIQLQGICIQDSIVFRAKEALTTDKLGNWDVGKKGLPKIQNELTFFVKYEKSTKPSIFRFNLLL